MAEVKDKLPDNTPGRFYVTRECIDCDVCRSDAPKNFTRNNENGYSFVFKQPLTIEEAEICLRAMNDCPVEAIGNDG